MITTIHEGGLTATEKLDRRTGDLISKFDCVIDYMENLRLIEKADVQITTIEKYQVEQKNFFSFVGESITKILEHRSTLTSTTQGRESGQ